MLFGLVPSLNSVNSKFRSNSGDFHSPSQFLSMEAYPTANATLFTQSLDYFRRELSECRAIVPLIYFCVFIPIVLMALCSEEEEDEDEDEEKEKEKCGGGNTVAEVAGESPENDASPGSIRLFKNDAGEIVPESYDSTLGSCGICFEEKQNWQIFRHKSCSHPFCYDCTSKHIAAKVQDNVTVILCPEIDCKAELDFDACRNIIPKDVIIRWDECLCMSLIPEFHKVYCPFKDCLAMLINDTGETIGKIKCPVCRRLICAKCRVPWHKKFTCEEFERLGVEREDVLMEKLAKKKSWRKCPNCNMYVEKTEGCLHIACRCGYEFCYMCGSKWDRSHVVCRRPPPPPSPLRSRSVVKKGWKIMRKLICHNLFDV